MQSCKTLFWNISLGPSNNLSFTTDIENNLTVKGSESEIRSILHTLITNACEANLNQGDVSITAKQREQQIYIEVKDQGSGLTEEISEKLFQPHISTKPEGAGMGLYIAKRLLSLHYNGSIFTEKYHNRLRSFRL